MIICIIAEYGRVRVCGCHAGISGPTLLDIDGCLDYVTLLEDDKVCYQTNHTRMGKLGGRPRQTLQPVVCEQRTNARAHSQTDK